MDRLKHSKALSFIDEMQSSFIPSKKLHKQYNLNE